jgi:hypothetical protein
MVIKILHWQPKKKWLDIFEETCFYREALPKIFILDSSIA